MIISQRIVSCMTNLFNIPASRSVIIQSIRTKTFKPNLLLPKYRTMKVVDGQWVEKDDVLILQNNLNLYPGENTTINYDYTVKATVPGFTV